MSDYPSANEVTAHIRRYVKHFGLEKHLRLGETISKIDRSKDDSKWLVQTKNRTDTTLQSFDKVIVATGPYNRPHIPSIPGIDGFRGEVLHAQAYKW